MWLLYLVALGGGYAIAHALGASEAWSAGAGWALAGVLFLFRRRKGYRAAIHVEQRRSRAEQLRVHDPEMYQQILAQANGTDAEDAARRHPDEYVALFLKAADDVGSCAR